LSTFALVKYNNKSLEVFVETASYVVVFMIIVLTGLIGIVSGLLEYKKKLIMGKEQEVELQEEAPAASGV
jgi:hypothetical protein